MADVRRLLALANGAALHKALLREVPGAKYRTVARWVGPNGKEPPAEMVDPILRAFGLGQNETAPAWWAEAESSLVGQIEERMRTIGTELSNLEGLPAQVAGEVLDELATSRRLVSEAPASESPAPQAAGRKRGRQSR